jgi:hypothetical protein
MVSDDADSNLLRKTDSYLQYTWHHIADLFNFYNYIHERLKSRSKIQIHIGIYFGSCELHGRWYKSVEWNVNCIYICIYMR